MQQFATLSFASLVPVFAVCIYRFVFELQQAYSHLQQSGYSAAARTPNALMLQTLYSPCVKSLVIGGCEKCEREYDKT
jgi:hypothetical protein